MHERHRVEAAAQEASRWSAIAAIYRRAGRDPSARIEPGKGHERRKYGRTAKLAHDRAEKIARFALEMEG